MIKKYKKQIYNSLIYTFSTILSRAIPFLLLPVFTTYLSKKDYGVLGLIASIFGIVSIYVGFRPSLFLIVRSPQMSKENTANYIFNIFVVSFYLLLIVTIVLLVAKYIWFDYLASYIFILLALLAFFTVFNEVLETIFQVERKAVYYGIYQILKVVFSVGLALLFIIVFDMGWQGKYFADILVIFSFALFAIYYLYKNNFINTTVNINKQKETVKYLFPLTFHVLGLVMMGSIDRIFLSNMIGLEATGVYTVAYTMGALIGVVHDALLKVWSPEFYKRIKDATVQTKIKILKFQYLYIVGSFLMYGVFLLVMPFVFNLMVNEKFSEGYKIIPIIALGLTFESLRKLFIGYHYNLGKNNRIAIITISAGLINAGLNYLLIPIYGIMGAAYATLGAYIVVACITIFDVNKYEKIPWSLRYEN